MDVPRYADWSACRNSRHRETGERTELHWHLPADRRKGQRNAFVLGQTRASGTAWADAGVRVGVRVGVADPFARVKFFAGTDTAAPAEYCCAFPIGGTVTSSIS